MVTVTEPASAGSQPEVRAAGGALRGSLESGVAVFRGVPYDEPPVGALRFAAPRPAARLPVMVWIYGGAYTVGMSSWPEYDGGHLARDGGVVVVTFNYRLGMEGFAQITGAPPNRGLLDQVAALEWVRDNIVAFGGDPNEITIFGESAGGGSVAALLAMPRAAGLFRRAVAQSVQGTFFSTELAADIASTCADELRLRPTVADLATVDPALLALAGDTVADTMTARARRWGQAAHRSILFAPVVDGEVLPATPWQAAAAGASRDAGPDQLYELVHSDWLFRMPTLCLAQAQVAGGGRVHFYELTWPAPGMGGALGACHGPDVPLVFGNLASGQPAMLIGESPAPDATALSARMRTAWTTFATQGDPGWPAYDPDRRLTQVFDTSSVVTAYPEERSRLIWRDHSFPPLLPQAM